MGRLTYTDIVQIEDLPNIAVETGTCEGEQLAILTQIFALVYGIEIDQYYYNQSRFNAPLAKMILGDSAEILTGFRKDERHAFFLDAHYCKLDPPIQKTPFPLWKELEIIKGRSQRDIIIIDDVHTFGKVRDDLKYGEEEEWETVTPDNIMKMFPDKKAEIYKDSFIIWL